MRMAVEVVYVIGNWFRRRSGVERHKFPKEFPVSDSGIIGAINPYDILVKLTYLNNNACFVPFQGESACLILDSNMIAHPKGREASSV